MNNRELYLKEKKEREKRRLEHEANLYIKKTDDIKEVLAKNDVIYHGKVKLYVDYSDGNIYPKALRQYVKIKYPEYHVSLSRECDYGFASRYLYIDWSHPMTIMGKLKFYFDLLFNTGAFKNA